MGKDGAKRAAFDVGYASDVGSRGNQEDSLGFRQYDDGSLLAVLADGMGGHAGGEVASEMAVRLFGEYFPQTQGDIPARLQQTLSYTHGQLCQQAQIKPELRTMGATLVAVFVRGNEFYWLSVGDSLLYSVDKVGLTKLNAEHTVRERFRHLWEAGKISRAEFEGVETPHALTSALGPDKLHETDSQQGVFQPDSVLVLASDGLLGLGQAEVQALVDSKMPAQGMADRLLQATLEKRQPGQDNIGIIVIRRQPRQALGRTPWLVALGAVLALGLSAGLLYQVQQERQAREQAEVDRGKEKAAREQAEADRNKEKAAREQAEADKGKEETARKEAEVEVNKAKEAEKNAKDDAVKAKREANAAKAKVADLTKQQAAAANAKQDAKPTAGAGQQAKPTPPAPPSPPATQPEADKKERSGGVIGWVTNFFK